MSIGFKLNSCLTPSLSFMSYSVPALISGLIFGKKIYLIVFRDIYYQNVYLRCVNFTFMTYLKKFITIKSLNTTKRSAGLSLRIIHTPPVSLSLLPKESKIKWFWLIIAGVGVLSTFQKNKMEGIIFPPKRKRLLWERNIWLLLIFLFINP